MAAGSGAPCASAAPSSSCPLATAARLARQPEPVGLLVDLGGGEPEAGRQHEQPEARAAARAASSAARRRRPRASGPARPARARRRPASRRSRAAAASSPSPEAARASRSAAAASAEPPPSPAATGMRLSILSRSARRLPARARAELAQRPGGEVLLGRTPGQITSSPSCPPGAASSTSSSASEIDCITVLSSWRPSDSRRGPSNRPRLTLAGASARSVARVLTERGFPPASGSPPATGARRARRAGARAPRARRAPARVRRAGASPDSASDPASVLRRWAKAPPTSARSAWPSGRRRLWPSAPGRRRSPTSTESTFGTGWKTVRGTARSTRTSQASCASTEGTP